MTRLLCAALLGALTVGMSTSMSGCFKPDHPACAFSCATPPHTCPQGFVCGADNVCHDPTSTGICTILLDAGQDEASANAGDGAARDAAPETSGDAGANLDVRSDSTAGG